MMAHQVHLQKQLAAVLQAANSPNPTIRRPAEDQLKAWETAPLFYSTLQDIFCDRSLDSTVRLLAILCLKAGIDKYWRKTAKHAIHPEEKVKIRSALVNIMDEDQKKLAVQHAVTIAKIARHDYPNEWPDLLLVLMRTLQATASPQSPGADAHQVTIHNRLVQQRALYTLHQVIKALCSKKLPASQRMLEQHSPEIFQYVSAIFYERLNHVMNMIPLLLQNLSHASGNLYNDVESAMCTAFFALKGLRRLLCYGFPDFEQNPETLQFFQSLLDTLQKFLRLRSVVPQDGSLQLLSSKFALLVGKVYTDLERQRLGSFLLAPGSIPVINFYWSQAELYTPGGGDQMYERFLVQGLVMLKSLIKIADYSIVAGPKDSSVDKGKSVIATELFTPTFVVSCCEVLVTKYLVLTLEEMRSWEEDPEAFVSEEEADHWEYNLRACAEKVLMDLVSQNRVLLAPLLTQMLQRVSDMPDTEDRTILLKDAVYSAVGVCAQDLFDFVDFDSWFTSRLIAEATNPAPRYKLLRRRISLLIGNWIGVKVKRETRPAIYGLLLQLASPDEDLAVRLTAIMNLRTAVDDWDFDPAPFVPYLEKSVTVSTQLVNVVDEFDSKMKVLNSLAVIIERMEAQIAPLSSRITELLPTLWASSEGQHMFRSSILVILTRLVTSLRESSSSLHSFIVPLIFHAVDTRSPASVYMLEDGLDLWLSTIQNTSESTPDLLSLYPLTINLLEYEADSLKKVLKLVESYVVLAPLEVLQANATPTLDAIARLIGDALKPEAGSAVLHCVDVILQACAAAQPPLTSAIHGIATSTGVLDRIVTTVLQKTELGYIITGYLNTLARMTINDHANMIDALSSMNVVGAESSGSVLGAILDYWIEKMDSMGHPKQRKLTAMACGTLLGTGNPIVMARIQGIFVVLSSAVADMKESDHNESDALVWWYDAREDDEDEASPDARRRKLLLARDPVHTTALASFVRDKVSAAAATVGDLVRFREGLVMCVDPTILEVMDEFMT
ncbi:hypothetical protein SeMB42_g06738 [Synchytrium endobioticum]|uniref:Importin N-terminal domain-containing protein n=1 Tax=Synchytrium endobioticum TaxID=286115 RepID=A0A507CA43_9FUNG|nr:hypothetical protein SeMB42_g06738 [Synchytrium endobioticum]TPX47910.1 hypothetical protein SeLEV6574_g02382 [Synchytrium endobioticum]